MKGLGYLPEERGLYPKVKVSDQIIYLAQLRGMSRKDADRNLKRGWTVQVPEYYGKKVEELSKGNQQKIQFIAAVIHNPKIVIMDEAFSGLDPVNVELLKSTVKELRDAGTSILFSTHRMEHVEELCRNITILHQSNPVLQGQFEGDQEAVPAGARHSCDGRRVTGLEDRRRERKSFVTRYGYELVIDE